MYGPNVAILLMYGSQDMRHAGFPQVDGGQRDPRERGVTFYMCKKKRVVIKLILNY